MRYSDFLYFLLIFIIIYLLFTFTEWIIHKYIMHNPKSYLGKYHVLHHRLTNDYDMTIKDDSRFGKEQNLCLDQYGIYGSLIVLPVYFLILLLFTRELKFIIFSLVISLIFIFFMIFGWNSIHSYIHHNDASKVCKMFGLSKRKVGQMKDNWYVKWVINNHILHHIRKEHRKGNYNIIFPGADLILGTYYTKS